MKKLPEIRYAILTGLATFLWLTLEYALGLQSEHINFMGISSILYYLVPGVILVEAIKQKRTLYNGSITYTQAFSTGLLATLGAIIICAGVQFLFYTYINEDYFKYRIYFDVQYRGIPQKAAAAYYNTKLFIAKDAILLLLFGAVTSAIAALKLKTE